MRLFVRPNEHIDQHNSISGFCNGCLFLVLLLLGGCGGSSSSSSSTSTDNSATLTWQSPTKNADGSLINDLAGHVIYMSSISGVYNLNDIVSNVPIVTATGGTTETFVISDLSSGTHFFQITAYNDAGFESAPSIEVQKTIQ